MGRVLRQVAVLLILGGAALLAAQTAPPEFSRQLTGSLAAGWFETTGRQAFLEQRRGPFATLQLDLQSHLWHPDFFTYRFQPRFSSGIQGGLTSVSEGSGLAFESVFLRRRPWPLRFRYSRFRRSALTSGLGSSYVGHIAETEDSALGVEWQYIIPDRPTALTLSYDRVSAASSPETVVIQGFETRARTFSLSGRDARKGWSTSGSVQWQRQNVQHLWGLEQKAVALETENEIRNVDFLAQRPIRKSLKFDLQVNRTANRLWFDRSFFDQGYRTARGALQYAPEGRFQGWTQVAWTESGVESSGAPRPGLPAVIVPSGRISNRTWDLEGRYQALRSLRLVGRSQFTQLSTPPRGTVGRAGNFWTMGTGAQFTRTRKTAVLSSSYFLYSSLTNYRENGSNRALSHAFDTSVAGGDPSLLRASGSFSVHRSREDTRRLLFSGSSSAVVRLALARRLSRRWTVEARGGLSRSRFEGEVIRSRFLGKDYGASLSSPTLYLGYDRSIGAGDSFHPLLGLTTIAPIPLGLPLLVVVGSSTSMTNAGASWRVKQHISFRGIWRGQIQTLASVVNAKFEQQEATFNYNFRRVRFEAGYVVYRYNFGLPLLRKGIILRMTRDFEVF